MSPLGRRWAAFACFVEEMPWAKVNFFLGAAVFVANTLAWWIAEAAASISTVYLDKGITVEHDPFIWIYGAAATWSGLNGAGFQIGKRATSKPDVIRAQAEVEDRRTGAYRAIPDALATPAQTAASTREGRTTAADDPRRGVDDDGQPL